MKLPRTGDKKLDEALKAIEEASEKVNKEWEKRKEKNTPLEKRKLYRVLAREENEVEDVAAFTLPGEWK